MRGELEAEQNCNILTPTLMAITAFLSRSPRLLNRGPGGPASLEHVPHSSIFSPTDLNFLSPGLYNNLTTTLLPASVTISYSVQPLDSQGHILIFLDQMHLLFTQVHFLFWQLGRVRGQYKTLHKGVGECAIPLPGLLHFTLDPYLIMLSVKQRGIKYHFLSLWYDDLGLNLSLPGHWWTLSLRTNFHVVRHKAVIKRANSNLTKADKRPGDY